MPLQHPDPTQPPPATVDELPARPRARRRIAITITGVITLGAVFTGGWFAATTFESPAQREATAKAPPPSAVTATVEHGDLARIISTDASIKAARQHVLSITGVSNAVVTASHRAAGTTLAAGDSATELNGRPLIVLPGEFPYYRDLTEGDTGPDVRQFQKALRIAGYKAGNDGVFGPSTKSATLALYKRLGYSPPTSKSLAAADTSVSTALTKESNTAVESDQEQSSYASTQTPPPPPPLTIPATELMTAATLPATIVETPAVGTRVSDETRITLESGSLQASSTVATNVAVTIKPGTLATLNAPDGKSLEGTVEAVHPGAETEDPATIVYSVADLPEAWRAQPINVMISIVVAAKDSLLVPSTALVSQGSASPYLLKEVDKSTFTRVPVKEIASLNGRTAFTSTGEATLRAGDRVRVR